MKTLLIVMVSCFLLFGADDPAMKEYGNGLKLENKTEMSELAADYEGFTGKNVQVSGTVTEVCENQGCWIKLSSGDGENALTLFVKVNDGDIVFPQEAIGKKAIVEGEIQKIEYTMEETKKRAKHRCEMNGEEFDPEQVKEPEVMYRLFASGALIEE